MKNFGLIGEKLSHSFSEKYFSNKFNKLNIYKENVYKLYEIENINDFKKLISRINFSGLNVTVPYKKDIIKYLDIVSDDAKKIGAVNTIKFIKNKLVGYNTDIIGFEKSLNSFIAKKQIKSAVVLGTGGSSLAIKYVLDKKKISYLSVSRNEKKNQITYSELNNTKNLSNYELIINTTPLGMYPNINTFPEIEYKQLNKNHFLFDLVYNPTETKFMAFGKKQKARVINGYEMLVGQAEASWEIWNK